MDRGTEARGDVGLHDDILLIETLPVEELIKVDHRMMRVVRVVGIRAMRLIILVLNRIEMVRRPIHRCTEGTGVSDCEVVSIPSRWSPCQR